MNKPKFYLFLILLLFSNLGWSREISSFNLLITHSESKRLYQSELVQTRVSSLTIYNSERISKRVDGSLILGYQEQIQESNSIVAARYAVGYFGGLSFNFELIQTENYRFNLFSQYRYHELEGIEGEQKVNISWYDVTVGLGNYYNLTTRLQLLADVSYVSVSGTQRAREPLSQTISFKNKSNVNYGLGFSYHINASGHLVIKWLEGAQQGFSLYLAKDF